MEVILIENIDKLGKVGDVVKVKDGYARNYLIPKKKVLRASKENLKVFEEKKTEIEAEENKRKIKSQEIAKKIKGLEILIIRNAAENGQLYGSVTSKDIAKEIISLNEVEFLNEQINLKKSIKSLGVYEVEITVYTDLKVKILVNVAKTKELGVEQINEYKNPKKTKSIKKEKSVDDKKEEKKVDEKLDAKDLIKEIEKKEEITPKKKTIAKKEKTPKTEKVDELKTKKKDEKLKKTKKKVQKKVTKTAKK